MKKYLILFLIFSANIVKAQYFDWNEILFSINNQGGLAWYSDQHVATDGKQIIKYTVTPCLMCSPEPIECYVDSLGNINGSYNSYWNGYRESYFDRFGNIIQVSKNGPHYLLNYFSTDTITISLSDTVPDFADGDYLRNLYLFYKDGSFTRICVYDSTGAYLKTRSMPGNIYKMSYAGEIYMCETSLLTNSAYVKKYDQVGNLMVTYPLSLFPDLSFSPPSFVLAKNSGKVWGILNNDVVCYDSLGTVTYSVPIIDNSHVSLAVDNADNLCLWEGNSIVKYSQNSVSWQTTVDAALTEKINVDGAGNIYYVCNYSEPFFDYNNGNFIPTSYFAPPAVAFKGFSSDPGAGVDINSNIVLGKINSFSTCAVNLSIASALQNGVPSAEFCSRSSFDVRINYNHLPVAYTQDTVYIELSNASGSFNSPCIIGKGSGLLIPCSIPDMIAAGNGYRIRAKMGNAVAQSSPYQQHITVKTAPLAPVFLENSIDENYACQPFTLKTNPDQNLSYDWFSVTDLFNNPSINYFQVHDSIIILPVASYEAIGVTLTNNLNGCSVTSSYVTPNELDSLSPLDIRIFIPDTLHINDYPVEVHTPGYLQGVVTGQGIYSCGPNTGSYYFFPDSVTPGLISVTRTLLHRGLPCVPFETTQYIYVDSIPRNIVCGDVEPTDKILCVGDSVAVPFTLLNPAVYSPNNIFVVELCEENPANGQLTKVADIGYGTSSPIICPVSGYRSNSLRFRVRSEQPHEVSTLNSTGAISVPVNPYVQFQENLLTANCYPTNIPVNIYSSYGHHQWFFNDTLIFDNTDWNVGITPLLAGKYRLNVTDPDNGCITTLGPIAVNDSAHIPSLTTDPIAYYSYSCGKTFPLIIAHTDSLSAVSWYFENTLLSLMSDSMLTFSAGSYLAVASSSTGCLISIYEPKYVYADPVVALNQPDSTVLCNGNSILLSVNDNYPFFGYGYQWIKNNSSVIAQTRQVQVNDSGAYYVVVSSTSGCIDTSETIYITASNNTVPVFSHDHKLSTAFISLYPNPSKGSFVLNGSNIADDNVLLNISDPYGRVIYNKFITASAGKLNTEIGLEYIADGLYFVIIKSKNYSVSLPLMVIR